MCVFVTTLLVTYRLKLLHLCFKMTGIEVVLPDGEKKKSKVMVLSGHKFLIFLPVPVLLSALYISGGATHNVSTVANNSYI